MKSFYKKAVVFWLMLLVLAFINAIIRETTYKPLLAPYIGIWAHQISSITGILLFFIAIYYFLKHTKGLYTRRGAVNAGLMWMAMTVLFESFMNMYMRKLSFTEVIQTYYFWRGETWIFVLISLVVSPLVIYRMLK